jgi:pre-mRNA-splicing factor SYF1
MNLGTSETIKQAFRRCIDLKVASPFIMISFANYLEKNSFYEESFKVYENALNMFHWPTVYEIWILYLNKFVTRY